MKLTLIFILLSTDIYAFEIGKIKSGSNIKDFKDTIEVTYRDTPMAITKPDVRYYRIPNFSYMDSETIIAFKKDKLYRILFNGLGEVEFNSIYAYHLLTYGKPSRYIGTKQQYWEWSVGRDTRSLMYIESFGIYLGDVEDESIN